MSRRAREADSAPEDAQIWEIDPFDDEEIFGYAPRARAVDNRGWTSAAIQAVRLSEVRRLTEMIRKRHARTPAAEPWHWREMPVGRQPYPSAGQRRAS